MPSEPLSTQSDSQHYTQLAEELMDAAWNGARETNGADGVIPIQLSLAQTYATLAVAAQIKEFRELMGRSYT